MWDPPWGNRRLLYDCVWIVSENHQCANPTSPLGVRLGWSKFAPKDLICKLHLSFSYVLCELLPSWLQVMKAQVPRETRSVYLSFPEEIILLANLTTLLELLRRHWLEDSNLVDPASSHMLVSKTKPCMSKYKWYTVKLRMAH